MSDTAAIANNNSPERDDLLRSIRNRKLVAITGVGFDRIASGDLAVNGHKIASWDGLLAHGYEYCKHNGLHGTEKTEVIDLQLRQKGTHDLIGAGQTILRWLDNSPGNHKYIWLESSVGKLQLIRPELVATLRVISPILATLNYGTLLEQGTGCASLHWKQYDLIARVFRQEVPPHVLHLHGLWTEPASLVLDYSSYHDVAMDLPAQGLMQNLFLYHRMLFVGCKGTFEDPNFHKITNHFSQNYRDCSHCHYVLCRNAETEEFQRLLQPTKMIKSIAYGDNYDDLPAFLHQLATEAGCIVTNGPSANQIIKPREIEASLNYKKPFDIWRMRWKR